jgi:hypothetical protein
MINFKVFTYTYWRDRNGRGITRRGTPPIGKMSPTAKIGENWVTDNETNFEIYAKKRQHRRRRFSLRERLLKRFKKLIKRWTPFKKEKLTYHEEDPCHEFHSLDDYKKQLLSGQNDGKPL